MGSLSITHLILFGIVFLVLFGGRNKISDIMGDVAKGIRSFKKGLSDDEEEHKAQQRPPEPARSLDHQQAMSQPETTSEPRKVG